MFYSHYRGRSCGRLIGALERYVGLRVADYATYGSGEVRWHGLYATYVWDGDTDCPFFTFMQDKDSWIARKQEFLRPIMDDEQTLYGNVEYTIQEIGMVPSPTPEEVTALMKKWLYHFNDDLIAKHHAHFTRCGAIWRHHYQWRVDSINSIGYAKDGEYPGIPDELILKPAPEIEYKEVPKVPRKTFAERLAALTREPTNAA
jgi:hypothetical protein